MTNESFRQAVLALFGPDRGWQARAADALDVHRSTVTRYINGLVPVSRRTARAVEMMIKMRGGAAVARRPHKPKVGGSKPPRATNRQGRQR